VGVHENKQKDGPCRDGFSTSFRFTNSKSMIQIIVRKSPDHAIMIVHDLQRFEQVIFKAIIFTPFVNGLT
jgi:hypothetical protein